MSVSNLDKTYLDRFTLGISLVVFTILIGTAANAWNQTVQYRLRREVIKKERKKGDPIEELPSNDVLLKIESASFSFVITLTFVIFILVLVFAAYAGRSSVINRLIS